jgi:hypothetical protein
MCISGLTSSWTQSKVLLFLWDSLFRRDENFFAFFFKQFCHSIIFHLAFCIVIIALHLIVLHVTNAAPQEDEDQVVQDAADAAGALM